MWVGILSQPGEICTIIFDVWVGLGKYKSFCLKKPLCILLL